MHVGWQVRGRVAQLAAGLFYPSTVGGVALRIEPSAIDCADKHGKSPQRLVLIGMKRMLLRLGAKVLTTSVISMYIVNSTW